MLNACTIDVEDYFQVSAFEKLHPRKQWDLFPARVEESTHTILEILERRNVRATFFILGWVAERFPTLVRTIAELGHEIGCHSNEHRLIYEMSPRQFRTDLQRSLDVLASIVGYPIHSFRAPSFSVTRMSLWALEALIEGGIRYDSSVYPVCHDRYGIAKAPIGPFTLQTPSGELTEFPPSIRKIAGQNLPVAGGGYFRLYPYWVTQSCVEAVNRAGRPVNVYTHPWEFDPDQPRISGISAFTRFRHYVNLRSTASKFDRLMGRFQFAPMSESVEAYAAQHPLPRMEIVLEASSNSPFQPVRVDAGHRPRAPRRAIRLGAAPVPRGTTKVPAGSTATRNTMAPQRDGTADEHPVPRPSRPVSAG